MQSYNCIIGVITLRQRGEPYTVVQQRYSIGSSAVTTIMKRFRALGISLEELSAKDPEEVQKLIYPQENIRRKDVPMPDFQKYYDRIMAKGSKVNISFCWMEYKEENPDGYESSQFYEYFSRFLKEKCGVTRNVTMAVHRVPGERVYIDWVGDTPELMVDQSTGEAVALHVFCTSVGVSDRFFARCFLDEKTGSFIEGTSNALRFYGAAPKYIVPDNCRTAVKSNTKDELVLNASYEDLEHFYNVIVLPPPYRKPKGKPTVEHAVKTLETHLIEKLKEKAPYASLDAVNEECAKIVADINNRRYERSSLTRDQAFEKYDKPHMKPLPDGKYAMCEYKAVERVPNNYHIEFDGHYYSVFYTQLGKPAILKATFTEVRICDANNRLLCTHKREYGDDHRYVTNPEHMPPDHRYYAEVNSRNGDYYRRWAKAIGPNMAQLIDVVLRSAEFEEQSYNSCNGILHMCDKYPKSYGEEAAAHCVKMKSMRYSAFKKAMNAIVKGHGTFTASDDPAGQMPETENVRGKDHWN